MAPISPQRPHSWVPVVAGDVFSKHSAAKFPGVVSCISPMACQYGIVPICIEEQLRPSAGHG